MPELLRLKPAAAAHFVSLIQPPEEEALTAALKYAQNSGLTDATARLFGRNIYLTDQPEPHGYEYYVTANRIEPSGGVETGEVSAGLYAMVEVKNLFNLAKGWKNLLEWVETNHYRPVGVKKGPNGWVNSAYEELLEWSQLKPPTEWRFRLWVQLRES